MVRVKRIGVLSLAKVFGLLYAALGLIFGAIFTIFSVIGALVNTFFAHSDGAMAGEMFGALFGIGSIILFPVMYGFMGFVMGLILATSYNFIARWTGGIEVETQ